MYFKLNTNGEQVQMTDEEVEVFLASLPSEEQLLNERKQNARAQRNGLLYATDWTQARDIPEAIGVKWAPYRQALRDVPQQAGFPDNITWPTKPE